MARVDESGTLTEGVVRTDPSSGTRRRTFGTLAALPCNVEAIEAGLLFAAGYHQLVAIVGPTGWGKSHLLEAVAGRCAQERRRPAVLTPARFLAHPVRSDPEEPVLIDDAQEALGKSRLRQGMRVALERAARSERRVILAFTLPKASRALNSFLPSPRDWTIAAMGAPEPSARIVLINQLATAEGLSLSPALVKIVARQMHGNGRTLVGALKRLRLEGTRWLEPRETLRACGLLDPFFADNSAWDLRMKILKVAEASAAQFSRVSATDLALYAMLHEAALSEAEVARSAGISPSQAYKRANRFAQTVLASDDGQAIVTRFTLTVLDSIAED